MGLPFPNLSFQFRSYVQRPQASAFMLYIYWDWLATDMYLLSSQVIPFSSDKTNYFWYCACVCTVTLEVFLLSENSNQGLVVALKDRGTESVGLPLGGRHVLLE